jgi:hypothetical protein
MSSVRIDARCMSHIPTVPTNVRFRGQSGHEEEVARCPLVTHLRHRSELLVHTSAMTQRDL